MLSEEIKRLHELHLAGALSAAEFEQAKAKVLAQNRVDLGKEPGVGSDFAGDFAARFGQLRRVRADRWLGGVCGGLARTTRVETWVWRLLFALFTLTWGIGAVVYLLLWLFVPEE